MTKRNFGFEAKPDIVESHGVVLLLVAAIVIFLGTLAVAHA
jgi:hypothetical protein